MNEYDFLINRIEEHIHELLQQKSNDDLFKSLLIDYKIEGLDEAKDIILSFQNIYSKKCIKL